MDLMEMNSFQKGLDGVETALLQAAKKVQEIKEAQKRVVDGQKRLFTIIIVTLIVSAIGVAMPFI